IREMTNQPLSAVLAHEFRAMLEWATRKKFKSDEQWFQEIRSSLNEVLTELGAEAIDSGSHSVLTILAALVQIRNKTKAHGAFGQDFYSLVNAPFINVLNRLIENCPLFKWRWFAVVEERGTVRVVLLSGESPTAINPAELCLEGASSTGVCFLPANAAKPLWAGSLLRCNLQCSQFLFPNGGAVVSTERTAKAPAKTEAEFIDYGSGTPQQKLSISEFATPPVPPPPSETQGLDELDIQSNVFGNLPPIPAQYVERPGLQDELIEKLNDKNHHIITLHGQGGMGKTSLALYVAHKIANEDNPPFENIVWFSARDVDLRPSGAVIVQRSVADLKTVSKKYASLFDVPPTEEAFANVLRTPATFTNTGKGSLFVFDNFETMQDATSFHKFLDTNTVLPNKVLMTSRERSFKADYPIEVRGMEFKEAEKMLRSTADQLGVGTLLSDGMIREIYEDTDGHAYVMRVIVGEIAREKKFIPIKSVVGGRAEMLKTVFERSFNKLSYDSRYVFLTVANWKLAVPELVLSAVLGARGIDVEIGIEQCLMLSLIAQTTAEPDETCFYAPQLARLFAQKKIKGEPDHLLINEDLEIIRQFGGIDRWSPSTINSELKIQRIVDGWIKDGRSMDKEKIERIDKVLHAVANLWPEGWLKLAQFRQEAAFDPQEIDYAYRRAVEDMADNKVALLQRAEFAAEVGDDATRIASLVSAVEGSSTDVDLIRDVAGKLAQYINAHKSEIPPTRRGVYLASVRYHMQQIHNQLDATGLSRLAWLFLLEDDKVHAKQYAELGLKKEPQNEFCERILTRIAQELKV
ncbi:MAG TPA: NB-ARC domain-containing protein, partial [Trichormus sp.]